MKIKHLISPFKELAFRRAVEHNKIEVDSFNKKTVEEMDIIHHNTFLWGNTPEGELFWRTIISGRYKSQLAGLARGVKVKNYPLFLKDIMPKCTDWSSSLSAAFKWQLTPQGVEFWSKLEKVIDEIDYEELRISRIKKTSDKPDTNAVKVKSSPYRFKMGII